MEENPEHLKEQIEYLTKLIQDAQSSGQHNQRSRPHQQNEVSINSQELTDRSSNRKRRTKPHGPSRQLQGPSNSSYSWQRSNSKPNTSKEQKLNQIKQAAKKVLIDSGAIGYSSKEECEHNIDSEKATVTGSIEKRHDDIAIKAKNIQSIGSINTGPYPSGVTQSSVVVSGSTSNSRTVIPPVPSIRQRLIYAERNLAALKRQLSEKIQNRQTLSLVKPKKSGKAIRQKLSASEMSKVKVKIENELAAPVPFKSNLQKAGSPASVRLKCATDYTVTVCHTSCSTSKTAASANGSRTLDSVLPYNLHKNSMITSSTSQTTGHVENLDGDGSIKCTEIDQKPSSICLGIVKTEVCDTQDEGMISESKHGKDVKPGAICLSRVKVEVEIPETVAKDKPDMDIKPEEICLSRVKVEVDERKNLTDVSNAKYLKKTKFTLVRDNSHVKTETPAMKDPNDKRQMKRSYTPTSTFCISKYSLKRIRRSVSDENKSTTTDLGTPAAKTTISHRRKLLNSTSKLVSLSKYSLKRVPKTPSDDSKVKTLGVKPSSSNTQLAARTIRSKYKMQKVYTDDRSKVATSTTQPTSYSMMGEASWHTHNSGYKPRRKNKYQYGQHNLPAHGRRKKKHRGFKTGRFDQHSLCSGNKRSSAMWKYGSEWSSYGAETARHKHAHWKTYGHRSARQTERHVEWKVSQLKRQVLFNPSLKLDRRHGAQSDASHGAEMLYPEMLPGHGCKPWMYMQRRPVDTMDRLGFISTRTAASHAVSRVAARVSAKYKKDNRGRKHVKKNTTTKKKKKKKKYCMFFNRFGKCNRKEKCTFIHDPERVAVCTRFLRGTCKVTDCPFSHKVSKEKMPMCQYFLKGTCNRDDCPYVHVNVNRDAKICKDFVNGFCSNGDKCTKKHILECPSFAKTGFCPDGKKCKLQHRKNAKRKLLDGKNSAGHPSLFKKIKLEVGADESPVVVKSEPLDITPTLVSVKIEPPEVTPPVTIKTEPPDNMQTIRSEPFVFNPSVTIKTEPQDSASSVSSKSKSPGMKPHQLKPSLPSSKGNVSKSSTQTKPPVSGVGEGDVPFKERKLPAYISLKVEKPPASTHIVVIDDDDEETGKSAVQIRPQL